MGYLVMVRVGWSPSVAALTFRHECALSQVSTHADMTLNVLGRKTTRNNQTMSGVVWMRALGLEGPDIAGNGLCSTSRGCLLCQ